MEESFPQWAKAKLNSSCMQPDFWNWYDTAQEVSLSKCCGAIVLAMVCYYGIVARYVCLPPEVLHLFPHQWHIRLYICKYALYVLSGDGHEFGTCTIIHAQGGFTILFLGATFFSSWDHSLLPYTLTHPYTVLHATTGQGTSLSLLLVIDNYSSSQFSHISYVLPLTHCDALMFHRFLVLLSSSFYLVP